PPPLPRWRLPSRHSAPRARRISHRVFCSLNCNRLSAFLIIGSARRDTRRVTDSLRFRPFANGLWSATLSGDLVGVGFAGAYMPGLEALMGRLPPGDASPQRSSQPARGG